MTVIGTNLVQMLENDIYGTLFMLQDALCIIFTKYGVIKDETIEKYNLDNEENENAPYRFNISLTTIRNYIDKYRFSIESKENCLIRKLSLKEVNEIELKLNNWKVATIVIRTRY